MDLGRMRYRVTVQKYQSTTDSEGFETREWVDVCIVWADIVPVSGNEYIRNQTETESITYKIYLRFNPLVENDMHIVYKDHVYLVSTVLHDPRKDMTTVLAEEVL